MTETLTHEIATFVAEHEAWPDGLEPAVADLKALLRSRNLEYCRQRLLNTALPKGDVLDMGCGSGRWSFALAPDHTRVHAVDVNVGRVEMAEYIATSLGLDNMTFAIESVTDVSQPDESFDAIVCYSVLIANHQLPEALAEMYRLLKPGGVVYLNLNGMGWNYYLRDEVSKSNPAVEVMGREGIFSTLLRKQVAEYRDYLLGLGEEDRAALISAIEGWSGNEALEGDSLAGDMSVVSFLDRSAKPFMQETTLRDVLERICMEAGPDYVRKAIDNLLAIGRGIATDFEHRNAPTGYDPEWVASLVESAGFVDFEWVHEGGLMTADGAVSLLPVFPDPIRNDEIMVWDMRFRKPGDAVPAAGPADLVSMAEITPYLQEQPSRVLPDISEMKLEDSKQTASDMDGVYLRRYPRPFRAALAINNDVDGTSLAAFNDWHDFVNGTDETIYGDGLGLEISDSFWIWCPYGQLSLCHRNPDEEFVPSADAERIVELHKAGFLDTLHSFGSWANGWEMPRDQAKRSLEILDSLGLRPQVWSDHGGGDHFTHSIGGRWPTYEQGDNPEHPSHCADLLRDFGFTYFWGARMFELDKFGDDINFASQADLDAHLVGYSCSHLWTVPDFENGGDPITVISEDDRPGWIKRYFNSILISDTLRDGTDIYWFKRYRGQEGPNGGNLIRQISHTNLDALERDEAAVIVYQHIGYWRALGMPMGHGSGHDAKVPVLDRHAQWAFRELAERYHSGRIFVTGTRRLLDYLRVRDNLQFKTTIADDKIFIDVTSIDCLVLGSQMATPDNLKGVTFKVPREKIPSNGIVLRVGDVELKGIQTTEEANHVEVGLPWQKLDYIPSA